MNKCWLCGRNGFEDHLDRHHIFHGPNRDLSEKYGAVVYLCHSRCHETGKYAAHRCGETDRRLKEYGQRLVMEQEGWSVDEFIKVFGKNYI